MPIQISWDNPQKTASLWQFEGRWTWADFYDAQQQHRALIQGRDDQIDVIADLSNSPSLPANAFSRYKNARVNTGTHLGIIVLVGANLFVRSMVSVFARLNPVLGQEFFFADSIEEARQILYGDEQAAED